MIEWAIAALIAIAIAIVVFIARSRTGAAVGAPAAATDEPGLRQQAIRAAFEKHPLPIAYINAAGRWVDVNPKLLAELGYTRAELDRTPLRLITHPDDRKEESTLLSELRSGARSWYAIRKRIRRKSGDYRTYRVQMLRCLDAPTLVYQCILDHTEHEQTTLERLAAALAELDEPAAILCDGTGAVTAWNRGAERLFGFSEVDVLGRNWISLHEDAARARAIMTSAARAGQSTTTSKRPRQDGRVIDVSSTILSDTRFREAISFLEIVHTAADATADPAAVSDAARGDDPAVERAEALQIEVARHVMTEKALRTEIGRLSAANSELASENSDLTRKLGTLTRGVRKIAAAREEARQAMAAPSPGGSGPTIREWTPSTGPSLPGVIREAAADGRTGYLVWTTSESESERRLTFDRGRIAGCSDSSSNEPLGQFLVRERVITEQQRRAALEAHLATALPIGASIIRMGFATRDQIEEAVRDRSTRLVADTLTHDTIRWAFVHEEIPEDRRAAIAIDVDAVLAFARVDAKRESAGVETEHESEPAAEERVIASEGTPAYVARTTGRSRIYHTIDCPSARNIPEDRRITFDSPAAAEDSSYRPCARCIPAVNG